MGCRASSRVRIPPFPPKPIKTGLRARFYFLNATSRPCLPGCAAPMRTDLVPQLIRQCGKNHHGGTWQSILGLSDEAIYLMGVNHATTCHFFKCPNHCDLPCGCIGFIGLCRPGNTLGYRSRNKNRKKWVELSSTIGEELGLCRIGLTWGRVWKIGY